MSVHRSKPEHEIAYQDVVSLLDRHAGKLDAAEMLAVAANMLGKLVAMQDQRTMTTAGAMEIIAHNVEIGNRQVFENLLKTRGNG